MICNCNITNCDCIHNWTMGNYGKVAIFAGKQLDFNCYNSGSNFILLQYAYRCVKYGEYKYGTEFVSVPYSISYIGA